MERIKEALKNKRALSLKQMEDLGFVHKYFNPFVKEGEYEGTFVMKSWGKSMNLFCFFNLENGEKIRLTVFAPNYSPKFSGVNLSKLEVDEKIIYKIKVGINSKGKPLFLELQRKESAYEKGSC